jgi:hypothetical protein
MQVISGEKSSLYYQREVLRRAISCCLLGIRSFEELYYLACPCYLWAGSPEGILGNNAKPPFFGVPPVPAFQRSAPILEELLWNHPRNPPWNAYCEPALWRVVNQVPRSFVGGACAPCENTMRWWCFWALSWVHFISLTFFRVAGGVWWPSVSVPPGRVKIDPDTGTHLINLFVSGTDAGQSECASRERVPNK